MSIKEDLIKTRDEYISLIKKELLGPGSEISIPDENHELISDSPNTRYSMGILFTKENKMNADNDDASRVENLEKDLEDIPEIVENCQEEGFVKHANSVQSQDEDNLDEEVGLAAQNMPSSMGYTFFVKGNVQKVNCTIRFGTYRKALASDCRIPIKGDLTRVEIPDLFKSLIYVDLEEKTLRLVSGGLKRKRVSELRELDILGADEFNIISNMYKLADQLEKGYVREPHQVELVIEFGDKDYVDNNRKLDGTELKITALRRKISMETYSISVMLVNDDERKYKPDLCIYQPEIEVDTNKNDFIFTDYSGTQDFDSLDDEEKSLELQYRNKKVYATGMGTSVNWSIDEAGRGIVYTDFFPEEEVPSMEFTIPEKYCVDNKALSMKFLSDISEEDKDEKIKSLLTVIHSYEMWINEKQEDIEKLERKYQKIAEKNIEGCKKAFERMNRGIERLKKDEDAWNAFQLANRAMFMQRAHLKLQAMTANKNRYPYDEELTKLLDSIDYYSIDNIVEDRYSWRPFQLAFLIMSIESIVNQQSEDRNLVDLIWFPTGGGKTEAYLGLTAFTIFYRRLAHLPESCGTNVIMRYTLRLLTAQQFTRASTLICACEYIRVDSCSREPKYGRYNLGKERITIGLWIGGNHTPNKNEQAKTEIHELNKASGEELEYAKDKHNKFQVLKCPWCGTKLVKDRGIRDSQFGYRMKNNRHFEIFCPQESCFFNMEGVLPIQVVDEELYDNPPTLLFGTVDKFAMLPWNPKIGNFFGVNSNNRAPELIIQDELHLISGPLGTMVGLYESAIDAICSSKGIKTKIIASTATIRRAVEQCAALYDRAVAQFPHPALDAEDSFFAREAKINYTIGQYGRKYVGLMPSGKTKAMMEIRSIAAMLQKANVMDLPYEVKDKFWTLNVYFNSLKDLGKCSTLVDDDVKDFIKRMAYRLGDARDARIITSADELTSRVSTTQLNETLDKLEKIAYSKENLEAKRWPSNVLLATNMISVGIDVSRLNVMLLVGQPKLTSEYIQASSRVGREYPGVAFAMYDGSKSRDRSHFEQFKGYHESFYKHVEPTGVTPFSKPARERALHAIVVSLLRQLTPELSEEKAIAKFKTEKYQNQINAIIEFILERNRDIIKRTAPNMRVDDDEVRKEINEVFDIWNSLVKKYDQDKLYYGEKFLIAYPEEDEGRLLKAYNSNKYDLDAIDTMTSMRNVDVSVGSSVIIWGDSNENQG